MLFAGGIQAHDLGKHIKHLHLFSKCIPETDPLAFKPLYKGPPKFPRRAQERMIEGTLMMEFTIKKDGSVHGPTVVWSSTTDPKYPDIFHKPALDAVKKFKYQPAQDEIGQPLETNGVLNQFTFLIEGYENSLFLGKHNDQFATLTKKIDSKKREKYIKAIDNILSVGNLSRIQRAAYLYLKAMYLYKDESPSNQIKDLLIESKSNYEGEERMTVSGYKLHSFAGILLGQMYLEESDWTNTAIELETALRAAQEASIQSERFFRAYIQLGIAHYNLKNWCEASSSWDDAKNLGKKHGLSLPSDLEEPMKFAKSKLNQ